MRTVTYKSVFDGAIARMGMDPSTVTTVTNNVTTTTMPISTATAFNEYITSAVRSCWEMYPWPELVRYENRQFYSNWASATTYTANTIVYGSDSKYYYAVQSSTAQDPTQDTTDTYWAPIGTQTAVNGSGVLYAISLDQALNGTTQTPIGEVLDVYNTDPRTNRYAARLPWYLTNDGVIVGQPATTYSSIPSTVWINFTIRPTTYTAPTSSTSAWSYTNGDTVPYFMAEAVKHAVCGMALREDGQFDKGQVMDQEADQYLALEFDKIEMKQGQMGRFRAMSR